MVPKDDLVSSIPLAKLSRRRWKKELTSWCKVRQRDQEVVLSPLGFVHRDHVDWGEKVVFLPYSDYLIQVLDKLSGGIQK